MTTLPTLSTGSATAGAPLQVVVFSVGSEEYCFEILKVREVIRTVPITAVPSAPPHVEGIINLRSAVVPIIDFRKRFNITGECTVDESEKVVIVAAAGSTTVGFTVDALSQVLKVPRDAVSPPPTGIGDQGGEAITGVASMGDRLIIVLDIERLFSEDELTNLTGVA
ncbi:chemotaxis protein CheW [Geobacter anodireducens]|uniref:Chemotaxis protein CheW n=1 Tax=Geobacter soli TaxID=1510391 RepID=A0A0C1TLE9_9BACT|nr:chemotaxis protein CheW [Geobacter soli]KIE41704.1 chemotaxis protein CheW [Geobacter soli]